MNVPDAFAPAINQHTLLEDVLAIVVGTFIISFGLLFLKQASLVTGGTAGMALLASHALPVSFGTAFFLLNLPFYYLSFRRMGLAFTLKTFSAIALVSLLTSYQGDFIHINRLDPLYGALLANCVIGVGFLILFRHRASLGGVNILALYLQNKVGIKAGWFQLGVDVCILCLSLNFIPFKQIVISVVGSLILNMIIAMNHRSDRYLA